MSNRQEKAIEEIMALISGLSVQQTQLMNQSHGATVGNQEQARVPEGNGNSGGIAARFVKVEFSRFDGEDVNGSIYRCEQIL